ERLCRLLAQVYDRVFAIRRQLAALPGDASAARKDMENQLERLFPENFPASMPDDWLWDISRYIKAIEVRIDKLLTQMERDRQAMQDVQALEREWASVQSVVQEAEPDFFWWLQELRVSLFAQQLGTRGPVSVKRLRKRLAASS